VAINLLFERLFPSLEPIEDDVKTLRTVGREKDEASGVRSTA
jgi:hypothetical protein